MPLNRRIGTITEISRSERNFIFEWKISNVFPRLGIVGDKYRSPFVTFLYAKFYLTVSVRRGEWRYENINLGLSRTLWQNRVKCSLCIRKSGDKEEEIVRRRIDSTFQNGFKLTFRNSQAVPPNPFIVICKMRVDERPLVREVFYNDSEMTRNVASSNRTESANLPTGRPLPIISQMSWVTGSSRAERNRPPSESLSSSSQMSRTTTSSVKQERRLSSDGANSWQTSMSVMNNEHIIMNIAMSFVSENIEEIMTTRGWQTFIQRDPIHANLLLLKATEK